MRRAKLLRKERRREVSVDGRADGASSGSKAKGRLVVRGGHRPILVIYDRGRVFALDNRCPHMGFPLERGSVSDGILTCHSHHARFDLEMAAPSTCGRTTYRSARSSCAIGTSGRRPLSVMPMPPRTCVSGLKTASPTVLGLVIAKAVHGQLADEVPHADIVRQVALFGAQNRDGWGVGNHDPCRTCDLIC